MMVFVPVWLVGALRRVRSARLALAEEALETERRRVDDELAATVGAQLEEVVRSGQRALGAIPVNFQQAEHELESLARRSRSALAEARRLIGHYKPVSSRAELEKAASLLRAAGIEVKVEVPDETLPAALDEFLRNSLRATVAKLLAEETNGPVALTLTHHDGASELVAMPTPIAEFLA
jgi:two-component system sensor histidine kinase DesK